MKKLLFWSLILLFVGCTPIKTHLDYIKTCDGVADEDISWLQHWECDRFVKNNWGK